MPDPPKHGQGKGTNARTTPNTGMTTRSQSKGLQPSPSPSQQGSAKPTSHTASAPSSERTLTIGTGPPKPVPPKLDGAYTHIVTLVSQILVKFNPPGQIRQALAEVIEVASKAAEEETSTEAPIPTYSVKDIHESLKADLLGIQSSLDSKLSDLQQNQAKLLKATESLGAITENLQSSTKDLEGRVAKVTDATDKIANTTQSYRDVLMNKANNPLSPPVDPRLLKDRDRKSRQILLGFNSVEENVTLNTSLADLKDKANGIIADMSDPTRPDQVQVENVTRTRGGSLLLLLNSKEAALWLKDPIKEYNFLDKFAIGSSIKNRDFNVLLRWVPIIFGPDNRMHHREIEEGNELPAHSVQKAHWIKPVNRRKAGQSRAHAILMLDLAEVANNIIRDGIDICGAKVRAEKTKQEPLQCLKCRGWEHKAQDCTAQIDTCGTCGGDHHTSSCQIKGKLFCASCKSNGHASWDRHCPEFIRRCAVYDERHPENNTAYFPTEQDWTLTTKPLRVPLSERFPQQYAVNSLSGHNRKTDNPVVRLPSSRPTVPTNPSQPQSQQPPRHWYDDDDDDGVLDILRNRTGANLIPLGRIREEGDRSESLEYESCQEISELDLPSDPLRALAETWNYPPPEF